MPSSTASSLTGVIALQIRLPSDRGRFEKPFLDVVREDSFLITRDRRRSLHAEFSIAVDV